MDYTNNNTLACVESSDNYIFFGELYEQGLSVTKLSLNGISWTHFIEDTEDVIPYDLDMIIMTIFIMVVIQEEKVQEII